MDVNHWCDDVIKFVERSRGKPWLGAQAWKTDVIAEFTEWSGILTRTKATMQNFNGAVGPDVDAFVQSVKTRFASELLFPTQKLFDDTTDDMKNKWYPKLQSLVKESIKMGKRTADRAMAPGGIIRSGETFG